MTTTKTGIGPAVIGRGLGAALLLFSAGCPGAVATPDAGGDAGAPADAPLAIDAGAGDAGATDDAAPADAGCGCAGGDICLRGVCLAGCGATAEALDAALAADLVPVAHYCRSPLVWAAAGGAVFEVTTRTEGTTVHFDLARWTATPGTSAPTPTAVASASTTTVDAGEMVFPGGYVAVSPDAMHAVFGYTTTRAGFVGGVFDVATAGGSVVATDAPGNFDAVFLDASRIVLNGAGLGAATGQGLYELAAGTTGGALVATGMGDSSGSIAYWASADRVVAGGASWVTPFPTGESERVFFVDPAMLSATSPEHLGDDAPFLAIPSAFWLVPGDGLVSVVWGATGIDHLEARWLAVDTGGAPVASAPSALTNDGTFSVAHALDGAIGLQHAGGILAVAQVD